MGSGERGGEGEREENDIEESSGGGGGQRGEFIDRVGSFLYSFLCTQP